MRYTYLLVDLASIIIPFIFSFHPSIRFDRKWKTFLPALFVVGVGFLVWDAIFTDWGVWGFTPDYLLGVNVFNLPVEEVLFFICIPYACVFTYHCFKVFRIDPIGHQTSNHISLYLGGALLIMGMIFYNQWYTMTTFILMGITLLLHRYYWKTQYMSIFYFSYAILLIPFFIVNGILTGTGLESQVVWYNDAENFGIRMGTIPIEDTFYGMLLILLIVTIHEKWDHSSAVNPQTALQ